MIHGDYAGYVTESGLDSVTQYELWKAVWSSLNDRNMFELAHALERHAAMVRRFLPQTFIGNHDVTRITSRLTDSRHLSLAIALLCMLPGVPTVYYGDEWGLLAVKEDRVGGDDAIRPALATSVEPPSPRAAAVADLYRRLIGLRRQHPWLVDATIEAPDVLTNELLAVRLTSDTGALAVVLAVGDTPADVLVAIPQGTVVAGPGSASPHSRGTAVGAPSHSVTVISGA